MTIRCMRIAFWIPKSPNTHSEYVILIYFPLQQHLHERASELRYIALPVFFFLMLTHCYLWDTDFSILPARTSNFLPRSLVFSPRSMCVRFHGTGKSFSPGNSGFPWKCYWSNAPYLFTDFDSTIVRRTGVRSLVTCDQSGTLSDIGEALNSKAVACLCFKSHAICRRNFNMEVRVLSQAGSYPKRCKGVHFAPYILETPTRNLQYINDKYADQKWAFEDNITKPVSVKKTAVTGREREQRTIDM